MNIAYGLNSESVEEVIALPGSTRFLNGSGDEQLNFTIERNIERGKTLAWEETYGPEEYTWTDIRQLEMATVDAESYSLRNVAEVRSALASDYDKLLASLRHVLRKRHTDLLDDVFADLCNVATKRAVQGRRPTFFEDILQAYLSGGWPCGWDREYPGPGRLIVYYPLAH